MSVVVVTFALTGVRYTEWMSLMDMPPRMDHWMCLPIMPISRTACSSMPSDPLPLWLKVLALVISAEYVWNCMYPSVVSWAELV